MVKKDTIIITVFFLVITIIFTIVLLLIPKNYLFISLVIFIILAWILYDRFIVKIMGWNYIWWSPHLKQLLIVKEEFSKIFDPEIITLDFLLSRKYDSFYFSRRKDGGFYIGGKKKILSISVRLKKDLLKITFWPLLSKTSVKEMKRFEEFIKES